MNEHRPLRVPKTAELVAAGLRRRIVRGELAEGATLPAEHRLMADLGVSRPTLREALRILEAEGLLSIVRGSRTGARVHRPDAAVVGRYAGFALQAAGTTLGQLFELRLAIEPHVARSLAERGGAGAIPALRAEAERLGALVADERFGAFMAALAGFHRALVEASGNPALVLVSTMLRDLVAPYQAEYLARRMLPVEVERSRTRWGVRSFHRLCDRIEAGEADAAEAHWRAHIEAANRAWLEGGQDARRFEAAE
ncbi:FadR/GntR family transcriptional regulator [Sphingomonas sp.]